MLVPTCLGGSSSSIQNNAKVGSMTIFVNLTRSLADERCRLDLEATSDLSTTPESNGICWEFFRHAEVENLFNVVALLLLGVQRDKSNILEMR